MPVSTTITGRPYAGTRGYTDQPTTILLDRLHRYRAMLLAPRPGDPPALYCRSVIAELEAELAQRATAPVIS